jgi:hypothetical protein
VAEVGATYKPGDKVEHSGIYDVIHDPFHRKQHQVTCVYNEPFPPCHGCSHGVRFRLAVKAIHLKDEKDFEKK